MSKDIKNILNELYEIEPSFREKEAELMKIIEKLLAARPRAEMDAGFKRRLKRELLRRIGQQKAPILRGFFSANRKIVLRLGFGFAAAAVVAVVLLVTILPPGAKVSLDKNIVTTKEERRDFQAETIPKVSEKEKSPAKPEEDRTVARSEQPPATKEHETLREDRQYDMPSISKSSGEIDDLTQSYASSDMKQESKELALGKSKQKDVSGFNTEEYAYIKENGFVRAIDNPLSTFSIDVDTAAYANVRRFVTSGTLPPPDAVRIEELVNYFTYDYPEPAGDRVFSVTTENAECPWDGTHRLVLIGIKGKSIQSGSLPPARLVFLIDTSGSMDDPNKLPLLTSSFRLLVAQLRSIDRIAIVAYAGSAGLVLPSTSGSDKEKILEALDSLGAGGSTAGGEGLTLAYDIAKKYYDPTGSNRVILATDGDFNVGPSSDGEIVRLIEERRNQGIFLTVLGFGMGNYKDSKMEQLADKGNGNYAYIDSISEANKVLVSQMGGTLFTIAKDVKIQVELNPLKVDSYRLIGYSDRMLAKEDFADDTKDAGELGAGHTVTALYEIVPATGTAKGAELKYQTTTINENASTANELMTLRLRFKKPDSNTSELIEMPVKDADTRLASASDNMRFAASVAEWGLILTKSEFKSHASINQVHDLASGSLGRDSEGYRKEFLSLVDASRKLSQ